jgi:hypothetical protein
MQAQSAKTTATPKCRSLNSQKDDCQFIVKQLKARHPAGKKPGQNISKINTSKDSMDLSQKRHLHCTFSDSIKPAVGPAASFKAWPHQIQLIQTRRSPLISGYFLIWSKKRPI